MRKARIGIVCLVRKTFDYMTAHQLYLERTSKLEEDKSVAWFNFKEMVIEPNDAKRASEFLLENKVDAVILVSATFHLGHLALIINEEVRKPMLLWGFDELPYDGGKIRLNAVCGVNLNASNLYKANVDTYIVHVGNDVDYDFIKAIKMKVAIENTNIGLIGYRAQGFFNVSVDEPALYNEIGTLISHFELNDLFEIEVDDSDVERERKNVLDTFDTSKLNEFQINQLAKLVCKAECFVKREKLDAIAIRCWPEFAKNYGISPCAMMSILQARGILLACEGDILAAISMLAVKAAGEDTPFMADLSQVNYDENYALLWHDGVAPCNLWNGKCNRSLETYFAGGKGLTADFVLKEGAMSILRIDNARGKMRVFYEEGDAVYMDKLLSGTYAKVIFDHHIKDVIDTVVYNGIAHHVIMGYTKYKKAIKYLARMKNWEFLDVKSEWF